MRWVLTVVLALVAGAACTPVATADELRYADQTTVAHGAQFDGTVIGGLSAISYHPGQRRYYVLSDDKAQHGPVRFYTAEIPLSDNAIDPVRFTGMQPLAGAGIADAEGLAVDAVRERLYWSTEGVARPATGHRSCRPGSASPGWTAARPASSRCRRISSSTPPGSAGSGPTTVWRG